MAVGPPRCWGIVKHLAFVETGMVSDLLLRAKPVSYPWPEDEPDQGHRFFASHRATRSKASGALYQQEDRPISRGPSPAASLDDLSKEAGSGTTHPPLGS